MISIPKTAFLLVFIVILGAFRSSAQSLRGKVIYVSPSQEVKLKFKSAIENYSFVNKPESGRFRIKANSRNLMINSAADAFRSTNIVITEGENTHLFILAYKDKLSSTETLYDFSSKERLEEENLKMASRPKEAPQKQPAAPYASPQPANNSANNNTAAQTVNKVEPKPLEKAPDITYRDSIKTKDTRPAFENVTQKPVKAADNLPEPRQKKPGKAVEDAGGQVQKQTESVAIKNEPVTPPPPKAEPNKIEAAPIKAEPIKPEATPVVETENTDSIKYELFIHYADSSAWITKDYETALKWYDSAQRVKPTTAYPRKQMRVVKQLQSERDLAIAKQKRNAAFNLAMEHYRKADMLRVERRFDESYKAFSQFLSMIDTTDLTVYMSSELHYINQAKDYLTRLEPHITKPKTEDPPKPAEEKPGKKKRKRGRG